MVKTITQREAGHENWGTRQRLLESHRQRVQANIIELQSSLVALDAKIDAYASAANIPEENNNESAERLANPI